MTSHAHNYAPLQSQVKELNPLWTKPPSYKFPVTHSSLIYPRVYSRILVSFHNIGCEVLFHNYSVKFLLSFIVNMMRSRQLLLPDRRTREFKRRRFWADVRQPEMSSFFSFNMPWRYQICVSKCLYSYRDDLPKNLFQITAEGCKSPLPVDMRRFGF